MVAQEDEGIGVEYKGIVTISGSEEIGGDFVREKSLKLGHINHISTSNFSENVYG